MQMSISKPGLDLIKRQESCVLKVYTDRGGRMTVGWGHLLSEMEKKLDTFTYGISQEEADSLLLRDVAWVEGAIDSLIHVPINQNQFDALCSLVFNCGRGPLMGTLGRKLNNGDYEGAAGEFHRWCHVGGVEDANLKSRRADELALWSIGHCQGDA